VQRIFSQRSVSLDREGASLKLNDYWIHLAGCESGDSHDPDSGNPRTILDHIGNRIAHTGASCATGVAYLVIILMLLTVIAELFLALMRALA
jgi:hypothetical protein